MLTPLTLSSLSLDYFLTKHTTTQKPDTKNKKPIKQIKAVIKTVIMALKQDLTAQSHTKPEQNLLLLTLQNSPLWEYIVPC
ncbi:hypothetical protein OGV83_11350 [Citrobacter sp. CK189]|uniref:hypothetical protein n=1 Tax=Citrobacter sp. CK189 TaxID=2985098 RepID=UPI002578634D|nr:hypothetical protein [Citrobacter sp. CK189]MDM3016857.1 hypothetical protein [Citrobacter sp. CK189]